MKQKLKNLWNYFTTYEKIWFISITVLAFVFAILFPEEDFGGVNGKVIMALYLLDIFLNITCELLISKQSKWNFIVSLGVEITEILICVVLSYRFATMATTLFFWIPIDIISFINWNRHKDREQEELTEVRRLTGKQEVMVIAGHRPVDGGGRLFSHHAGDRGPAFLHAYTGNHRLLPGCLRQCGRHRQWCVHPAALP